VQEKLDNTKAAIEDWVKKVAQVGILDGLMKPPNLDPRMPFCTPTPAPSRLETPEAGTMEG
jgi:hypothetical protein